MHDETPTRLGKLADALTISRGIPTQVTARHGQLPVLSVPELRTGTPTERFVDEAALADFQQSVAREEDVLISLEGAAAGQVFVVPDGFPSFVPSQQVAVIRIRDRSRLDPWYLGAFLSTTSARTQMQRLARGQKVQRIPVKDLDTVTIPMPTQPEQAAYGRHYKAYQRAIRAHRETAQHLAVMCATDLEMNFGSFATNSSR